MERGQDFLYYSGYDDGDFVLDCDLVTNGTINGDFFYENEILPYEDIKTLIGYKLIKPELINAVVAIGDKGLSERSKGTNGTLFWMKNMVLHTLATIPICNLIRAGVLDLWFEPVYEEKPTSYVLSNGQKVFINNGYVVVNGTKVSKAFLKSLLPVSSLCGWEVKNVRMDIGCWKNVTGQDIENILKLLS